MRAKYRATSQAKREKGSYFRFEARYADLYSDVWLFGDWAKQEQLRRIHGNAFLTAKNSLYMNATPRIYADSSKAKAEKDNIAICFNG